MVMRWYKNGSACEYLSKINPNADRLQLVSCGILSFALECQAYSSSHKILDVARGLEYLHTAATPAIVHADLKGVR